MKIISHSADADGIISAFLVAKKFGITNNNDIILMDYGKPLDWFSQISEGEEVVICDFSFENKAKDMKKLMTKTDKITWLDHHISAINEYGDFGKDIPGLRIDGISACMLTYVYFYVMGGSNEQEFEISMCNAAPWLVQYANDHDVWIYKYGENTENFSLGWKARGFNNPLDPDIERLYSDQNFLNELLSLGKACKLYRNTLGNYACNEAGFEVELCGYKGFALNNVFGGSEWFVDKVKEYDFVCSFYYSGKEKQYKYSFYSDKSKNCDCSKIAKSIDSKGGGHLNAAGCVSKKFIF